MCYLIRWRILTEPIDIQIKIFKINSLKCISLESTWLKCNTKRMVTQRRSDSWVFRLKQLTYSFLLNTTSVWISALKWWLLPLFHTYSHRPWTRWKTSGQQYSLTCCPTRIQAPTSWRAQMKSHRCWTTTMSWRRACPSLPSKSPLRPVSTPGRAKSEWLRYTHKLWSSWVLYNYYTVSYVVLLPSCGFCRTCWRSGWHANAPGFT